MTTHAHRRTLLVFCPPQFQLSFWICFICRSGRPAAAAAALMKTYTSSSDSIRWKGGGGLINRLQPKLISLFIQSDVLRCTVGRCALVILSTCQSQLASSAPNTQRLLKAWESWWQPQPVTEITSRVCVCLCVCSCCWMPRSVSLQRRFADCRYACVMCWSRRSFSACPTATAVDLQSSETWLLCVDAAGFHSDGLWKGHFTDESEWECLDEWTGCYYLFIQPSDELL